MARIPGTTFHDEDPPKPSIERLQADNKDLKAKLEAARLEIEQLKARIQELEDNADRGPGLGTIGL